MKRVLWLAFVGLVAASSPLVCPRPQIAGCPGVFRPRRCLPAARASTKRLSPTTRRRFGSNRSSPRRITTEAMPTRRRANATRPLPTTPMLSSSNRKFAQAYSNRGGPTLTRANTTRRLQTIAEAIQLSPKSASAYYYRGDAYEKKGEKAKAEEDFGAGQRNLAISLVRYRVVAT